jgi:hypothetical protein
MTLLSICADAADELGLDARPISVVGNPAPEVQRLLRFAQRVGRDLVVRAPWQALRRRHSFVAAATEIQPNAIPADFGRFYPETFFDQTNFRVVSGPLNPTEYESRKIGAEFAYNTGGQRWFTRLGNSVFVTPTPAGNETYTFDYQSISICASASGTPQAQWLADTDTALLDEELITLGVVARYLDADGQPAQMAMASYERRFNQVFANDAPTGRTMVAGDVFAGSRKTTGEPGAGGVVDGWSSGGGGSGWVWG